MDPNIRYRLTRPIDYVSSDRPPGSKANGAILSPVSLIEDLCADAISGVSHHEYHLVALMRRGWGDSHSEFSRSKFGSVAVKELQVNARLLL
jgi:hypothetical protein